MARHWSPDPVFRVLVVCTGNICRSALAERLGRAYLDDALGDAAEQVHLSSAGTGAVVGSGMHPDTALVLAGFGGDHTGFVARQLAPEMVVDADLTLTLTRAHRGTALAEAPRALARTFTLREAADLLALVDPDVDLPGDAFADRARALVRQMAAVRARRAGGAADDIGDPIGQPIDVQQQVGDAVVAALVPILARLVDLHGGGRWVAGPSGTGAFVQVS
ncbi:protein-tyrosine-phosphatase [Goekera deserti]|uniref:Protein-tyrosine-phosphatase n=1 Tax=Goekera deserti TaxID=2497753 RepID=A0A7K3WF60_9ACTN|nr:protein-tyrosine-phosphatase [Goekera deserti]NDI48579.1 protein-tyrosine-phosphatase [Goekera deserti]NEL55042.1 protein-tyrosine-phosphatase [Goekera deserti]